MVRPSPTLEGYVEGGNTSFMREVARIAIYRGISQKELARRYNSVASGGRLSGNNIREHFRTTEGRLSKKVRLNYAEALEMLEPYPTLAAGLRVFKLQFTDGSPTMDLIDRHLEPDRAKRLFEEDAIDNAVRKLASDRELCIQCIYTGLLNDVRSAHMPKTKASDLSNEDVIALESGRPILILSLDPEERRVQGRWLAVADSLWPDTDLYSAFKQKSVSQIAIEETLLQLWKDAYRTGIDHTEWLAVQNVLTAFFARRNLPVAQMIRRLHSHELWSDFELGIVSGTKPPPKPGGNTYDFRDADFEAKDKWLAHLSLTFDAETAWKDPIAKKILRKSVAK